MFSSSSNFLRRAILSFRVFTDQTESYIYTKEQVKNKPFGLIYLIKQSIFAELTNEKQIKENCLTASKFVLNIVKKLKNSRSFPLTIILFNDTQAKITLIDILHDSFSKFFNTNAINIILLDYFELEAAQTKEYERTLEKFAMYYLVNKKTNEIDDTSKLIQT